MRDPAAPRGTSWLWSVLWLLAALAACLSVALINGRPLFYFDTGGYIEQGTTALDQLGLVDPAASGAVTADGTTVPVEKGAGATVDGSRSAAYAIISALFVHFFVLDGVVLMNAVLVMLAVWLPMLVAHRLFAPRLPVAALVALPLMLAALGSMPFYVAFLMPDIFTGILLISIATLTVFARDMRWWEIGLAMALAALSVVSHLSHLAVAGLMLPLSLVVALAMSRRRWWLPPLLVLAVVAIGYGEHKLLKVAAKAVANSEVILKPFLTARLVQDGPGLAYLDRHCPDAAIATCPLHDALQLSDDPWRLTATHIIFETSPQLGSFRLMSPEDQRSVARAQFRFFFDVLSEAPVSVVLAILKNTLVQAQMFSVDMTMPSPQMVAGLADTQYLSEAERLVPGRISGATDWLADVTAGQRILYLLSLGVVALLWLLPNRVPLSVKVFAAVLVLGILANAVVCGAVSQPATRYGARVIWLLPVAAAVLALFAQASPRLAAHTSRAVARQ